MRLVVYWYFAPLAIYLTTVGHYYAPDRQNTFISECTLETHFFLVSR
jgi:hypothetical protein